MLNKKSIFKIDRKTRPVLEAGLKFKIPDETFPRINRPLSYIGEENIGATPQELFKRFEYCKELAEQMTLLCIDAFNRSNQHTAIKSTPALRMQALLMERYKRTLDTRDSQFPHLAAAEVRWTFESVAAKLACPMPEEFEPFSSVVKQCQS